MPANPKPRDPGPFVARERELDAAFAYLESALAHQGRIVLVVGEPGIGKTRLAQQIAAEAAPRGAHVLWGRCYEGEGAPAYWPWIQILRACLPANDTESLRSAIGADGPFLAQIVPEIGQLIPDMPELPALSPEQSRFRLFDAVTRLLKQVAEHQPSVIVLEDMHWADRPSLLLLEFLAREMQTSPMLALVTYRNVEVHRRHPLSATLAVLAREPVTQRISLHRFSEDEVGTLAEQLAGAPPAVGIAQAIWRETEGNPFFVTEVIRLLEAEGSLDISPDRVFEISIPESVRSVVGQRLDRLSPECNDLLLIGAVVGREFDFSILEHVTEKPGVALLPLLDEASQAQIIEVGAAFGQFRFGHRLIQETLYAELSTFQRFQLHSRVGAALEARHAANPREHFGTLAHHYAQAPLGSNIARAVDYATKAAQQAMQQVAWEQAVSYYELALQMAELQDDPDLLHQCELLLALGTAQGVAGTGRGSAPGRAAASEASATYWKAVEVARLAGSPSHLARAAMGTGWGITGVPFTDTRFIPLVEEVLTVLSEEDSVERAIMQAGLAAAYRNFKMYSGMRFEAGSEARIEDLSASALAMADRVGDQRAFVFSRIGRLYAIWHPSRSEEIQSILGQLLATRASDDLSQYGTGTSVFAWSFLGRMSQGDVVDAKRIVDELTASSQDLWTPRSSWIGKFLQAGIALSEGRFTEAEVLINDADAIWPNTGTACNQTFALCREQDRLQDVEPRLTSILKIFPQSPLFRVIWILYLLETGQEGDAREQFASIDIHELEDLARGISPHVLAICAELCVAFGDEERARACYMLLESFPDHVIYCGYIWYCAGSVSHYLGLLAGMLRRWDQAEAHFEAALNAHTRIGFHSLAAHTRHEWARTLLQRGQAGDRNRAGELLDRASETADRLGMIRLQNLIASTRGQLGAAGASFPYGLSQREVDVLRLVVDGLTDAEIAEQLFLSPRTVSTYLSSTYNKLGVNSRAAAAAITVRAGLA